MNKTVMQSKSQADCSRAFVVREIWTEPIARVYLMQSLCVLANVTDCMLLTASAIALVADSVLACA